MDEVHAAGAGRVGSSSLVGRHVERRLVRHLLDEVRAGRHATLVVSGVPGVGKTALLRWLAEAAGDGVVLRTSGGTPSLPGAALLRLVAPLPELAGVSVRWRGVELAETAWTATDHVAAEVVGALAARAQRQRLTLVVDDADELEPVSRRVLEQVLVGLDDAAIGRDLRLLVAVAGGVSPDPDGLLHRLLRLGSARALALGGLDEHDVFEMLAAAGRRPTPTAVHEVVAATGGVPLLVESEVELRARPAATPVQGVRVRSIADAHRVRLDKVDARTRRLLTVAALLAEPWDAGDLAVAAGRSPDEVAESLAAAVAARILDREAPGGLRFTHPLLRSDLVAALSPEDRAGLHGAIADRLAPLSATRDDVLLQLADHLVRAGGGPGDVLRRAGRVALLWGAWHEASRFLSAAATGEDSAEHHLEAGIAAWYDHDVARCEAELGRALRRAAEAGDNDLRLRAAVRLVMARVGEQPLRFGQRPDVGELEEALAADKVDPLLLVEGQAVLADAIFASGEADRAFGLVISARQVAARAAPDTAALQAPLARLEMAEGLHRMAGLELNAAAACFDRGARCATTAGDALAVLTLRNRAALVALCQGRVDEARRELAAVEDDAADQRLWGEAGFAAAVAAVGATLAGDPAAPAIADRARRLHRRSGHSYTGAVLAPVVAASAARHDGLGPADDELRPSSAVGVLCAVEAHDVAAARARLAAARWRHGGAGPPTLANLPVLAALVEAGDLVGDGEAVRRARPALVRADEAGVAVVLGWPATVARLLAIAARHDGDPGAARHHIERALRLTEHEDLPVERAKALVELAHLDGAAPSAGTTGAAVSAEAAATGGTGGVVAAVLGEAAGVFDGASMFGWVGRCEAVARSRGVTDDLRPSAVVDDRTVFTDDVVGSTAVNARLGDALYLESLRVHDRIVRSRLRQLGGEEIKHTGDGVNAIFRHATEAARCSLAIQADMAAWGRAEPDLALQVRCGLARGSLIPADGDYFGLVQSEAARLCSLARPGEVLVSGPVAAGIDAADLAVESAGRHLLRGVAADEVEVHRILPR